MRRLIKFECRKAFFRWPVAVLCVLLSIINILKVDNVYHENSYLAENKSWDIAYWELYGKYSGEMTLDKVHSLLDIYHPLEEQTADMTATSAFGVEGTITGNIWSDKNLLDRYYVSPMQYCYTYQNLAMRVCFKARENVELFTYLGNNYEVAKNERIATLFTGRQINNFHYTEGWLYYTYYDFSTMLVLLLCFYGIAQVFTREKESRMDKLLPTSRNGRQLTTLAKVFASTLFIVGISLWFSVLDFVSFSIIFGMSDGIFLPIYAIENLSYTSIDLSIWQYAIVTALSRTLGVWVLSMAVLLISVFCQYALIPIVAGVTMFLCLVLAQIQWGYSSHAWLKIFNPYSLMDSRLLYGKTEFVNFFGIPLLTWEAALLAMAVVGMCLVLMIFRFRKISALKGGASI